MLELLGLSVLAIMAWIFLDGIRVRELATGLAKEVCATNNLQFLDGTVAPLKISLGRGESGTLRVRRTYQFEFSDTGDNRLKGRIVMDGKHRKFLDLENFYMEQGE